MLDLLTFQRWSGKIQAENGILFLQLVFHPAGPLQQERSLTGELKKIQNLKRIVEISCFLRKILSTAVCRDHRSKLVCTTMTCLVLLQLLGPTSFLSLRNFTTRPQYL